MKVLVEENRKCNATAWDDVWREPIPYGYSNVMRVVDLVSFVVTTFAASSV